MFNAKVWEGDVLESICVDPAECVLSHVVVCIVRFQSPSARLPLFCCTPLYL